MKGTRPRRPIFRDSAVRRYAEAQRRGVLPAAVRPRFTLALWLLTALLVAGGAVLACAELPELGSRSLVDLFIEGGGHE